MERISIDLIPGGYKPTCHATQFDDGRVIRFDLFNRRVPYTLISGESVEIKITKPNGAERTEYVANTQSSYVDWTTVKETCDVAGDYSCELVVSKDGQVIGSGNFTLAVEIDAYGDSTITVHTASGAIATFTTNIVDLLQEVKCEINAKQDLHGYDHPWPAGGGKNKLEIQDFSAETYKGVTFSCSDGVITANGTAESDLIYVIKPSSGYVTVDNIFDVKPDVQYTLNGCSGGMYNYTYWLQLLISGSGAEPYCAVADSNPFSFTAAQIASQQRQFAIRIKSGVQMNNVKFYPMIREASETNPNFEPYENICPITGYSSANITRCGGNLFGGTFEIGHRWDGDGSYSSQADKNAGTPDKMPCKPNTTYAFIMNNISQTTYMYLSEFDVNENHIQKGSSNAITTSTKYITFTTGANTHYIAFSLYANTNFTSTEVSEIAVNYPSTDTTYHAYNGQTYAIAFGQTVYGCVLDVTRGKLHVTNTILDLGSLPWTSETSSLTGMARAMANNWEHPIAWHTPLMCSAFKYNSTTGWNGLQNGDIALTNAEVTPILRIRCEAWAEYTNAQIKEALVGIKLVYRLATPFDIDLTPQQIEALLGVNNVWHDANGNTEVKYLYKDS